MRKQSKKIITMMIAIMLLIIVPVTSVSAVPKKSGIDSSMSAKLTKAYNTKGYTYKGKKVSYLKGLTKKWAQGKISKNTLIKKATALKWTEKSFYPDSNGEYTPMKYTIGKWDIDCGSFSTTCTAASSIRKFGMRTSAGICGGREFNCAYAVWNKSTRTYKIYYFGTGFN